VKSGNDLLFFPEKLPLKRENLFPLPIGFDSKYCILKKTFENLITGSTLYLQPAIFRFFLLET